MVQQPKPHGPTCIGLVDLVTPPQKSLPVVAQTDFVTVFATTPGAKEYAYDTGSVFIETFVSLGKLHWSSSTPLGRKGARKISTSFRGGEKSYFFIWKL